MAIIPAKHFKHRATENTEIVKILFGLNPSFFRVLLCALCVSVLNLSFFEIPPIRQEP